MHGRRSHRVKAGRTVLTRHAFTIYDLDAIPPLTANRVEIARTTRHLILTEPFDHDTRVASPSTLDSFSHLFFASQFNHFSSPFLSLSASPTDRDILTQSLELYKRNLHDCVSFIYVVKESL
jgi:hypothetical protein